GGRTSAAALGSAAVIGKAGKGFEVGMSWIVATVPFVLFSILLAVILGPTIRKLKLYTLPDLFVRRFGKASGIVPALVIAVLYMTPTFGMQIVAMGSILTSTIDISMTSAMLLGFVVCVLFTLLGGLPSVAWTDAIQSVLILVGIVVLFIAGLDVVVEETPDHLLSLYGAMSPMEMLNYFIIFSPF